MATYKQVSYGSQGSDVTDLQKLLNQNGYSLAEDGIFGAKTQEAVKDYQQKNNLSVDGIVGTNTWGALTGASATQNNAGAATGTTAANTSTTDTGFKYDAYQESDTVKQAQALLQQQQASKPGAYQSQWQGQLDDIIGQILNRDKFSYDLNADALYQQYANQYMNQGRMAMMDTMGQAAAMTGGYGNSYAQSVGQQAYQGYLQQLNDKVPELYQLALNRYQMEGDALYDQYALLGSQEEQDYGRYRDDVSTWYTEMDRLQDQYNAERDYDYGIWQDGRDFGYGQYIDDRNYGYQQGRDQVSDSQWQQEFDEAVRQFNFANGIDTGSSGSSGGSIGSPGGISNSAGGNRGSSYDNGGLTAAQIREMQEYYGATVDGSWGQESTAAADGRSAQDAWVNYQANKTEEDSLDAYINDVVKGYDSNGNKMVTSSANRGTVSGQEAVRNAVNEAINAALAAGEITAQEAAERRRANRGYTY